MYQLSGQELQDALSKGRISAEAVEVAFARLTSTGGKYANGAIAQSIADCQPTEIAQLLQTADCDIATECGANQQRSI